MDEPIYLGFTADEWRELDSCVRGCLDEYLGNDALRSARDRCTRMVEFLDNPVEHAAELAAMRDCLGPVGLYR